MSFPRRSRAIGAVMAGVLVVAACGGGGGDPPPPAPPPVNPPPSEEPFWSQWGANPRHTGSVGVVGQGLARQLADIVYDPFVDAQMAESNGALLTHYQAPIVDGNDVYVMRKSGQYSSCSPARAWVGGTQCGPNAWHTMVWNEARYSWVDGALRQVWVFATDWKPPPNGQGLSGWEPVFHPIDVNGFIYVPGAGGTVWKVDKGTGTATAHVDPFAGSGVVPANTFVAGPLVHDAAGNVYYNVIELVSSTSAVDPWRQNDVVGAWLVRVAPDDTTGRVSFATLVPDAPAADAVACPGQFTSAGTLPWPPDTTSTPAALLCGGQRPGINVAPAIADDGTIYTISRAHFVSMAGYLVAVNADLTPKWAASLQHRFNDGCGVIVPIAPADNPNQANSCRNGANVGVDPRTNQAGSGVVSDLGTSSPVVLPDGSVLYGAQTNYNGRRGHLMHFSAAGDFVKAYDFGWDITPAIWEHDGTWSIVIKDNHYAVPMYCTANHPVCQPLPESYYITQLGADLAVEWRFLATNTLSCAADPGGGPPNCVDDHPNGFEWCINMPAIDANGTVYANSEDGRLYALAQGQTGDFTEPSASIFLHLALGAAYTPLALGADGLIYTQNDGHLFVVGD